MKRLCYISPLIYWCAERERIRKLRQRGLSAPWTPDPILQQYRFCNLRRKDDRVSQWIINNVLSFQHMGFSTWSFLQFTALCRWINWPPTLAALLEEGLWPVRKLNFDKIASFIEARSEKTWTGAYMIRAAPKSQYGEITKGEFVCNKVVGGMDEVHGKLITALASRRLERVWEVLYSIENWGPFMSQQVVADWTYTPLLDRAEDLYTWAAPGPGSVRGYNRLLGLPLKQRAPDSEVWCDQLRAWRADIIAVMGAEYNDLPLMDVSNALCETDKYLRVKNGEGRPRSMYSSEGAY